MGQYYNVYTKKNDITRIYNRTVDKKYTMAKLLEHSWWRNPFVNTICHKIHFKPTQIAWVGDYAQEFKHYDEVWGENAKTHPVTEAQVTLDNKYLCNHTKKEYLDCNKYYNESLDSENWCLHPLPLLTAIGNGKGGGDYDTDLPNSDYIGYWAMDTISVENEPPKNYNQLSIYFKEE